jgi:hypothetical protein
MSVAEHPRLEKLVAHCFGGGDASLPSSAFVLLGLEEYCPSVMAAYAMSGRDPRALYKSDIHLPARIYVD